MDYYRWQEARINYEEVYKIQKAANVTLPTAMTLANRGLTGETIEDFLQPTLKNLIDPYLLAGARSAAARLWQAVSKGEKVLIHGDYDTDGITAAILLSRVLAENGLSTEIFLPHRIEDGYGLTIESIEKAGSTAYSLLLTVDCGITSVEAVAAARRKGIDVIITDHHEPGDTLPDAYAIVNPKLQGTPDAMRELAGVGVAFKLCHAFIKFGRQQQLGGFETDLRDYLDLVAIGTVADIVPLLGENRCLVRHGLPILSRQQRPGIRALCEYAGLSGEELGTTDIAFRLAPRLNAPGRMGDASLSISLLTAKSMAEASPLAALISETNQQRRLLENQVLEMAEEQLTKSEHDMDKATIVVHGSDWHQGVLGIVAARLSRARYRPVVVLSQDLNGDLCGSVRSIPGVNLIKVLHCLQPMLERYGGHAMAAGLLLKKEKLEKFKQAFEMQIKKIIHPQTHLPQLDFEGPVQLRDLNERFFAEHRMLEPFGHSNPEPLFICRQATPEQAIKAGREHCRGTVRDQSDGKIDFIAFRRLPTEFPDPPWDLAIKPHINTYHGFQKPQVEILDVRTAGRTR